jgi:hypothetical protein
VLVDVLRLVQVKYAAGLPGSGWKLHAANLHDCILSPMAPVLHLSACVCVCSLLPCGHVSGVRSGFLQQAAAVWNDVTLGGTS